MKIFRIILIIFFVLMAAVFGVIFGILAPVALKFGGLVSQELAEHHVLLLWIVGGVIGSILPCVLFVLKRYGIAFLCSAVGTVLILIVHSDFEAMRVESLDSSGSPSFMYLPQIFTTVLLLLYFGLSQHQRIHAMLDRRERERNAAAPSILSKEALQSPKHAKGKKRH
jgi:Na+/phosphate symporter